MTTKIAFEDNGQDFLTWEIDGRGNIVSCKPFQFDIWSKWRVVTKDFKIGGFVTVKKGEETMTVKYAIEKVTRPDPRTFAGWQKRYPDALKINGTCGGLMTTSDARKMLYGEGVKSKLLANSSTTSITKKGATTRFSFVFSIMALEG